MKRHGKFNIAINMSYKGEPKGVMHIDRVVYVDTKDNSFWATFDCEKRRLVANKDQTDFSLNAVFEDRPWPSNPNVTYQQAVFPSND